MNIIELARNGDINVLWLFILGSWAVFTPLSLLIAKYKNRLSVGVTILSIIPAVNMYAIFFLLLLNPNEKASK